MRHHIGRITGLNDRLLIIYDIEWLQHVQTGNNAFSVFLQEVPSTWLNPTRLIDTNWADRSGDVRND